jgi:hypothetical protein
MTFGQRVRQLRQGEELILTMAKALDADTDGLLLLAKKIPESVKRRVIQRPEVFRTLAALDDEALDQLLADLGEERS